MVNQTIPAGSRQAIVPRAAIECVQLLIKKHICCRSITRVEITGLSVPSLQEYTRWEELGRPWLHRLPTINRLITTPCENCFTSQSANKRASTNRRILAWMAGAEYSFWYLEGGEKWATGALDPNKDFSTEGIEIMGAADQQASGAGTEVATTVKRD